MDGVEAGRNCVGEPCERSMCKDAPIDEEPLGEVGVGDLRTPDAVDGMSGGEISALHECLPKSSEDRLLAVCGIPPVCGCSSSRALLVNSDVGDLLVCNRPLETSSTGFFRMGFTASVAPASSISPSPTDLRAIFKPNDCCAAPIAGSIPCSGVSSCGVTGVEWGGDASS